MYRIRLHGRGGQGIKTAGRLLGTAFFLAGFEVQDAPRYGAERRGAPIFAYVRADRRVINERGVIHRPDLVVAADETLLAIPAAGVLEGATPQTVLLLNSKTSPQVWRERLNFSGLVLTLPDLGERQAEAASTSASPPETAAPDEHRYIGAACTGAAARLVGVITRETLAQAVRQELGGHGERVLAQNLGVALKAYDLMAAQAGRVTEAQEPPAEHYHQPQWIELPAEAAEIAAPAIYVPATSEQVPTGLWRTVRPVIDYERCKRCAWICSTLCPDGVISVDGGGYPHIDYQHCKGCLICMAQCPSHAIRAVPEQEGGE